MPGAPRRVMAEPRHFYLVALGSNMRVPGVGGPMKVLRAAIDRLAGPQCKVAAVSGIIASRPIGPSIRRYANAAAVIETGLPPPALLDVLQEVEREFGRRRRGARWRARPLDLDIVLWSGGVWASADLTIPHPLFRERDFVIGPAAEIAPNWRDPVTALTLRQLAARIRKAGPVPRA